MNCIIKKRQKSLKLQQNLKNSVKFLTKTFLHKKKIMLTKEFYFYKLTIFPSAILINKNVSNAT